MIHKIEWDIPSYFEPYSDKEDVEQIITDVLPVIVDFYSDFGVLVDVVKVSYCWKSNSPQIDFVSKSGKPYCKISINTTQLGAAFIPPSKRVWDILFIFLNVDIDKTNEIYSKFGLSCLNIETAKRKSGFGMGSKYNSVGKIKHAISCNIDWIDSYFSKI